MDYKQHHLRNWLADHPLISIQGLEALCEIPKDTLRHFMKERRALPERYLGVVTTALLPYGVLEGKDVNIIS